MNPNKLLNEMLTDPKALFRALQDDYNNRMMAEEARREAIERAQEMQREADALDDGQDTDLPEDDNE